MSKKSRGLVDKPVVVYNLPEVFAALGESSLLSLFSSYEYMGASALSASASVQPCAELLCSPYPAGLDLPASVAGAIHWVAMGLAPDEPLARVAVWQSFLSRVLDRPARAQSHLLTLTGRGALVWSVLCWLDPVAALAGADLFGDRRPHLYYSRPSDADGRSYLQLPSSDPDCKTVRVDTDVVAVVRERSEAAPARSHDVLQSVVLVPVAPVVQAAPVRPLASAHTVHLRGGSVRGGVFTRY